MSDDIISLEEEVRILREENKNLKERHIRERQIIRHLRTKCELRYKRLRKLEEHLQIWMNVRQQLFAHCLSDGVFNIWQKEFDCTSLNDIQFKTEKLIKRAKKYV